jgi:hypothetical protein
MQFASVLAPPGKLYITKNEHTFTINLEKGLNIIDIEKPTRISLEKKTNYIL